MRLITDGFMNEISEITQRKIMKSSKESVEWRYDFLKILGTFSQQNTSHNIREI